MGLELIVSEMRVLLDFFDELIIGIWLLVIWEWIAIPLEMLDLTVSLAEWTLRNIKAKNTSYFWF
jgi:hypothetical protein